MTQTRTNILSRLKMQQRDTAMPPMWQTQQGFDDLAEQFVAALTAVHGEPHLTPNLETAAQKLGEILTELGAKRVVCNDEVPLSDLNLAERWPAIQWHIVGQSTGDLRDFSATADAGLSSGAAAIAETGTLVIRSGPGKSRVATLFPPVHIALLPTNCLTTDLFTFTASRTGDLPANMTFVSGPSKTADIEQTMAIGVHGPKRFIVILYRET
ncbi:MAG: lactate utilization protein [Ardenticatenaceae bacterium]|nr:lactate utilization protein [Anaerolineales bacterium]MCB8923895.1 lactate utilization protein [Ardenticatenaceae bacterium]MCB8990460.1 lactate utilization protein [Ardenticatenaceae bacterium]MCB9003474.1 lactate utilization protein [Ardenticatenaceae bacterium]